LPAGVAQKEASVGKGLSLLDGHNVGETVTTAEYDTGGLTRRVERQDGLVGHEQRRSAEIFKHDFGRLLAVTEGVEQILCEQNRALFRGNVHLFEDVVPHLRNVNDIA
jgi:hypothetical protein